MADGFWPACTDVIKALRRNDAVDAVHLFKRAEALLNDFDVEKSHEAKRRKYLEQLKAHLAGAGKKSAAIEKRRDQASVDESLFYPRPLDAALRKKLGIPQNNILVVADKGGSGSLGQAVKLLKDQGSPATLLQVFSDPESKRIDLVRDGEVIEIGLADRHELPDVMATADILVYAGNAEPVNARAGASRLLEHFAMGRPLVLPRSLYVPDVVHKQNAYVLDTFDASGIATAILEIQSKKDLAKALEKGAVDYYLKAASSHNADEVGNGLFNKIPDPTLKPISSKKESFDKPPGVLKDEAGTLPASEELKKLNSRIQKLEQDKSELSRRLLSMPTIDPLCLEGTSSLAWPVEAQEDFGIIVFGHTRMIELGAVLESLKRQDALKHTEVWLDGFQGNHGLRVKVESVARMVDKFPVKLLHKQSGNFGFRKMLILGLIEMCKKYRDIMILEDDCFPTHDAVSEFRRELDRIRDDKSIFSVYGHHFNMECEGETCTRFQGWGWATTREKLMPKLRQLIDCYSMTEEGYLKFVNLVFTPEIKARIEVTPPRLPSYCLEHFFAWDETLTLLAALDNQTHRPTKNRTIYNCGMGADSTHFPDLEKFRNPPFNLITPDEVWKHF